MPLEDLIQQEKEKISESKPSLATRQCSMKAIEKISVFTSQLIEVQSRFEWI